MATAIPVAQRSPLSYYYVSMAASVIAVLLGFYIGGLQGALIVAVLAVLETSLSLDNAVVNARILKNWDEKWRKIFLTWGIWIAVFGMRIVFPIAIVSIITGIGPVSVIDMALNRPAEYSAQLTAAHPQIAGFGAAFLLMVGLGFFFAEKHVYWMEWAETKLTSLGQIEAISAAVTIAVLFFVRGHVDAAHSQAFFDAGLWGLVAYVITHGLGTLMEGDEDEGEGGNELAGKVVKAGVLGFLYLEVLDASFSFDGVIGAFALSNYLPIIALGLGVGAFFVRSFTIHMVDAGVMDEYRYLEHGAFYAILALASIMLISATGIELPEWFTGLIGAAILGASFWHSIIANRRDNNAAPGTVPAAA